MLRNIPLSVLSLGLLIPSLVFGGDSKPEVRVEIEEVLTVEPGMPDPLVNLVKEDPDALSELRSDGSVHPGDLAAVQKQLSKRRLVMTALRFLINGSVIATSLVIASPAVIADAIGPAALSGAFGGTMSATLQFKNASVDQAISQAGLLQMSDAEKQNLKERTPDWVDPFVDRIAINPNRKASLGESLGVQLAISTVYIGLLNVFVQMFPELGAKDLSLWVFTGVVMRTAIKSVASKALLKLAIARQIMKRIEKNPKEKLKYLVISDRFSLLLSALICLAEVLDMFHIPVAKIVMGSVALAGTVAYTITEWKEINQRLFAVLRKTPLAVSLRKAMVCATLLTSPPKALPKRSEPRR